MAIEFYDDLQVYHSDGSYALLRGQGLFLNRSTVYVAPLADNFSTLNIGYDGARWGNVEINAPTVKFENGANEFARITSTGNVGIGTTSPIAKLDIAGNGTGPSVYDYVYTTNSGARIHGGESALDIVGLADGNHASSILIRNSNKGFGFVNNPSIDALQLKSFTANNDGFNIHGTGANVDSLADIITIEKTGNVGIGTTTPGEKLTVSGAANITGKFAVGIAATHASFDFYNQGTAYFNGAVTVDDPLTVNGTNITVANASNPYLYLNDTDAGAGIFQQEGNTTRIGSDSNTQVVLVQNNATAVTIDTSKNVGIGTTAPSEKLEVAGNIKLGDSNKLLLGTSSDLQVYHNSTDSYIENYTGNLTFRQRQDDGDIMFECDDGGGGTTQYFRVDGGAVKTIVSKNFAFIDDVKAEFGDSGDFQIYHDGTNSYIDETGTGSLYIKSAGAIRLQSDTGENMIYAVNDGAVNLYYNNANKLQTSSTGVTVAGTVDLTNLTVSSAQGTDGQVLTSTGSGVAWEDAGGGSGTVTSIVAGTGLTGGTITTSGTIALDYAGNDNFILASGTQLTSADDDDSLAIIDVDAGRQVKHIEKSDFLEDQVTSVTTGEPSGSDAVINIVSLTQAEYDAGTPVATTLYIIT